MVKYGGRCQEKCYCVIFFCDMYGVLLQKAALRLGYESLKEDQELAIASFVSGNDVFVSLHRVRQVS